MSSADATVRCSWIEECFECLLQGRCLLLSSRLLATATWPQHNSQHPYIGTMAVEIKPKSHHIKSFIYQSRIRRPSDIATPRDHTSYTNARLKQTMQNVDNYLRDGHLKGPDIRPVGDRAPPCLTTHALFDLYFAQLTNSSSSQW